MKPLDEHAHDSIGAVVPARQAEGGDRYQGASGDAAARRYLPGLRAGPAHRAGAEAEAVDLQSGRFHLPQGRHRQGDVHREEGQADGAGRRSEDGVRDAERRDGLRRDQHPQHRR